MAQSILKYGFSAGELSPNMYGRLDLEKYALGAELIRNFYVDYRGGISNRPGTKFIDYAATNTDGHVRLLPFVFSQTEGYLLEFTPLQIRVFLFGELIDTIVSPWNGDEIWDLKYTQSADVMTIDHPDHMPYDLRRTTLATFELVEQTFGPEIDTPTNLSANANVGGNMRYAYCVTAIDANGQESLQTVPVAVTSAPLDPTSDSPKTIALEWTGVTGAVAYNIYKVGPVPSTRVISSLMGYIGQTTITKFTDTNIAPDFSRTPPIFRDPFAGGQITSITVTAGGAGYSTFTPCTLGDGDDGHGYLIADNGGAVVGVVILNPGKNNTVASVTPTGAGGGATFSGTVDENHYKPATVSYFQQRRVHGGSYAAPELLELSQISAYLNFDYSAALLDSDAITVSVASREVNQIKHFVPMSTGLVVMTVGGAFLVTGGQGEGSPVTPTSISALPQAATGVGNLAPIVVNYNIIFQQAMGSIVRDMAFNFQTQSYYGTDRSMLANHLFNGYSLVDWAFAEEPNKLLWALRNDGKALTMTYVPDQEVYAWARHDTNGLFKSVCSVPEEHINAVYFIVRRHVEGEWRNYIERLMSEPIDCIQDAWYLDCAVKHNGDPGASDIGVRILNDGENAEISGYSFAVQNVQPPDPTITIPLVRTTEPFSVTPSSGAVDWDRRMYYESSPAENTLRSYSLIDYNEVFFNPAVSPSDNLAVGADGTLYGTRTGTLRKYNPATLTSLASLAVGDGWWVEGFCVLTCNGVDYGLFRNQVGNFTAANLTTMAYLGVVGEPTEGGNLFVAGAQDGTKAVGYLVSESGGVVGVYRVEIETAPADAVSMTKLGTFTGADVPGWTEVTSVRGMAYDQRDDTLLVLADSTPDAESAIIKVVPDACTVSWKVAVESSNIYENLTQTRCRNGMFFYWGEVSGTNSQLTVIQTADGSFTNHLVLNVTSSYTNTVPQYSNDDNGEIIFNRNAATWTLFGPGGPATLPEAVLIGCALVEPTDYENGILYGNVLSPFQGVLANDPQNTVVPVEAGDWFNANLISELEVPHLIGKTVGIIANGSVYAQTIVPDTGLVPLDPPASWVVIGLPYQSQMRTLRLEAGELTVQGRRKLVSAVTARVVLSRGLKFGTSLDHEMYEYKDLQVAYNVPQPLLTQDCRIALDATWEEEGYICVQQDYPLPATVVSLIPEVVFGDNQR